jgi:AcrR family transcriptional regulator
MSEGQSKGEQTRQTIISCALRMVSERGYEGLSIGALALETELSKSGLFAHFKSKEALQLGVLQEVINQFTRHVVQPALAAPRGEPRLRILFEKKLEWIRGIEDRRGCLLNKASVEYDNRDGHSMRERLVQALKDWQEVITRSTQAAIDEGHFRAGLDAEEFADEFEGIMAVYQQRQVLMRDRTAPERARAAFASLLERSRHSRPR